MPSLEKKKYVLELWVIALSSSVFYAVLGIFYMLLKVDVTALPVLGQTFLGALFENGVMGLGITIVCVRNRESFASFGLKKEKLLPALLLSALACLPELLYVLVSKEGVTYCPFQNVNFTKPVLASAFPVNVIGMLIIIITWGFFEGFSYIVLADRINRLVPPKNRFLNWGAIICGAFCLLLHILVGQTYSIGSAVTSFLVIYGMLVAYRYTGNAWGCVFFVSTGVH